MSCDSTEGEISGAGYWPLVQGLRDCGRFRRKELLLLLLLLVVVVGARSASMEVDTGRKRS